jgi:hypothetical protein
MVNLSSLFRNKVVLINAVVIASVLITIIILNTPTQMDYEELATIPYDYTPSVYVKEWIPKSVTVEVKQPEFFAVDYALYTAAYEMQATATTEEQQPYPMSPASSMLVCSNISINDTVLVLAVKKMDTTPSVYAIVVNDKTICYFSDPFPTGYNSIVVMLKVNDEEEKVKVEIKKVKELG